MSDLLTPRAESSAKTNTGPPERDLLTMRERGVWRRALLLLGVLAVAFAFVSWDSIRTTTPLMAALPIGLVILVALFGTYVWTKTNEISELRGLVRGIEHRANSDQDTHQLDQLFSLISRSQQGYRDLIDTFDDSLFSVALDGKILAVNRSFADLVHCSFADVVGRTMDEFFELVELSGGPNLSQWLPVFLQKRRWTGVIRVRAKHSGSIYYFDCVLHAIVRDEVVHGISGFARDITR